MRPTWSGSTSPLPTCTGQAQHDVLNGGCRVRQCASRLALNADRPGLLYGSPVYRLDHRDQGADRDERGSFSRTTAPTTRLHLYLLVMLLRVSAVRLTVVK